MLVATTLHTSAGVPITDGTADATGGVVALVMTDDDLARPYCTGTLIAPALVATAAHCVTDDGPSYVVVDGKRIAVALSRRASTFDPIGLVDDVAVLELADVADVEPIAIGGARAARALQVGARVRIVGYGRTSADQPADGVRRAGDAQIAGVGARDFVIVPAPAQPCFGDSGGPALMTIDGQLVLVGVASSGDSACEQRARFIRVDPFTSDLLDTQPRLTGGCAAARGSPALLVLVLLFAFVHRKPRR